LEHWQFGGMASMAIFMSVKHPKAEGAIHGADVRYVRKAEMGQ
jgi:hypothetical protein